AVADNAPGVRLDHLGNGLHGLEATLSVSLEDKAVMAEQTLGPVPGARSPFLDLRPNAESDARVLLEPLHEALGLVEFAIRLAGVGLDGRLRLFVVKVVDLAFSLVDLVEIGSEHV